MRGSFEVVVYDRRGHSLSTCPPDQGRVHDDVDDLAARAHLSSVAARLALVETAPTYLDQYRDLDQYHDPQVTHPGAFTRAIEEFASRRAADLSAMPANRKP